MSTKCKFVYQVEWRDKKNKTWVKQLRYYAIKLQIIPPDNKYRRNMEFIGELEEGI